MDQGKERARIHAPNVDNNVTVGELGQRLRNNSLSASESTGNAHGTTLNTREQRIEDTLSDNQRAIGRELLSRRTGHPHRPSVHHAVLSLGTVEVKLQDLLINSVASFVGDAGNGTLGAGWEQDLVLAEKTVLENGTEDVAAGDVVADLELAGCEVPLLLTVERGQVDTAGNVNAVGVVGDTLERALDTVVNGLHQTGAELDGQGLSRADDRITDSDTGWDTSVYRRRITRDWRTSLLVDLNGGLVGVDSNDLSYQALVAYTDLKLSILDLLSQ
jgi:hypothetical protein